MTATLVGKYERAEVVRLGEVGKNGHKGLKSRGRGRGRGTNENSTYLPSSPRRQPS